MLSAHHLTLLTKEKIKMTKINPVIVYVGELNRALALQAAVKPCGWTILFPEETMEALAMQVFYYPDAFVIEESAANDSAREVYAHLRSVEAENLVVLTNAATSWGIPADSTICALPTYVSVEALVNTLTEMVEPSYESVAVMG
jgi:hypothetical protein